MTIPYYIVYTVRYNYSGKIDHLNAEQRAALRDELLRSQFRNDWFIGGDELLIEGEHEEDDDFDEREIESYMSWLESSDFEIYMDGDVHLREYDSRGYYYND